MAKNSRNSVPNGARNSVRNSVRIIGGTWRSRVIRFPDASGLRPSPDRVRETLFNWLGQDLTGLACLDLFAGSGALGFEAASRGASSVVMLETAPEAAAALRANASLLDAKSWRLAAGDALEFLRSHRAGLFDVVFLDPPFASGLIERVLPLLPGLLAPGARVYVESGEDLVVPEGWQILRQGKAGVVRYHLLQKEPT
ncbi:MAG: 16S rRNA (guanine(966)-N(2))-methyltransferase RsmD [Proteobacteria bacterium]|nr:16S rRNA (guanine(966)-N(2))-methyltransferase RsmD [Pseudomonadota bacterium]